MWGTGKVNGSFGARISVGNQEYVPAACFTAGGVEFELYWMRSWPPFDDIEMRRELVRRLNRIPGANIPEDDWMLDNKRPAVLFDAFTSDEAFELLTDAPDWFAAEARAHIS